MDDYYFKFGVCWVIDQFNMELATAEMIMAINKCIADNTLQVDEYDFDYKY